MHRGRRIGLVGFAAILAIVIGVTVSVSLTKLPADLDKTVAATPVLTDRHGVAIAVLPTDVARDCRPLRLREMGEWLPLATVGIEDHRFWQHPGVDVQAALGAALRNLRNGTIISGASTISQQLIKLTSQRSQRTYQAKFYEARAALKLEQSWDKKKILESYLNRLDYGNRRIGPEAAALAYFGKSVRDLSLAEAIFLAGLPQSPVRLNPWKNPAPALARYQRNVRRLDALGLLPGGVTAEALLKTPIALGRHEPPDKAPHFAEMIRQRDSAGARTIQSSLDLDWQQVAARALKEHLAATLSGRVNNAAVVILENATGEVRALACAGAAQQSAINSAMEPRSCGSTLKPFLYLAAIESRQLTAASLLPDVPDAIANEYRDYDPQNYSSRYLGPMRVREALGNSLNVPAVIVLSKLGARESFARMQEWGLRFSQSFDAYGAGFILGNAPVRLLDLAGAYAALARGGVACPPRLTPRDPVKMERVATKEASAIITNILSDNTARRRSFGTNSVLNLASRTAAKTGTSSQFRDGWCVGFNGTHTVAVWTGNLDGQPMNEMLAVRSAAPLWAAVMKSLYAAGDRPWQEPEGLDLRPAQIDPMTGLLSDSQTESVTEWFLPGTEPKEFASSMYKDGTLILPAQYGAWCASPQNRLAARAETPLKILFPKDGAQFAFNPTLPANQQTLVLQSTDAECEWFLNGSKLGQASTPLQAGEWVISAKLGDQSDTIRFFVK